MFVTNITNDYYNITCSNYIGILKEYENCTNIENGDTYPVFIFFSINSK